MTVTVFYTCPPCGLKDRPVEVPVRGEEEDVRAWMDRIGHPIALDHEMMSPACTNRTMESLKIPLNKGDDARIGDYVSNPKPPTDLSPTIDVEECK